uniref:Uncharacterized protein n=1 Tax=Caenorhabditis tropicalis TaxID=1561998 RepID=A0A1I7TM19_9PELO
MGSRKVKKKKQFTLDVVVVESKEGDLFGKPLPSFPRLQFFSSSFSSLSPHRLLLQYTLSAVSQLTIAQPI